MARIVTVVFFRRLEFFGTFSGAPNATGKDFSAGGLFRAPFLLLMRLSVVFLYFAVDGIFPDNNNSKDRKVD